MVEELRRNYPSNTVLNLCRLPAIGAAIELNQGHPSQQLVLLEVARPYELGGPSPNPLGTLYPAYLRGQAYLLALDRIAAAAEFRKILERRGTVLNEPIGPLARLQIGRAYSMAGDTAKAKAAAKSAGTTIATKK